jgi:hypothetical protein
VYQQYSPDHFQASTLHGELATASSIDPVELDRITLSLNSSGGLAQVQHM